MTTITKLTGSGFKSFAKKTDLLFGNNFNCIIGPNGSGKSNVMDALCFVLGKSSAKGLRAEKSANLIYNGGKKGTPSKKAEVHIFFDNAKNEFPFNTPEIKISRVLNQKGVSDYRVNDKSVTRQQVIDLLNKVGVDPNGHNIILQGDIVHFMEMRPNDRRELIEEISGISIFEDKKNKSLNELEKVEGKLTEANVLLVERETNLRELKKERDQAKRYVDLKNKIKDSKATFLNLRLKDKKAKKEKIQKIFDNYDSKINGIQDKIRYIRKIINEKQDEVQNINYELDQKGEGEQKILQSEINDLKAGIFKHEARVETLKNELSKIKTRKKQLSEDIIENDKKINSLKKKKESFQSIIEKNDEKLKKINNTISSFKKKHGISDIDDINVKLDDLDKEIENKEKVLKSTLESKQDLIRELDRINFRLDSIKKDLDKINQSKNSKRLKELKTKHDAIEKELNKAVGEDSILSNKYSENWTKLNSLSSELAKLKGKEASIKEFSNDKGISKVKKLKGVMGTVSELGSVNDKYSLAMSVAAGARARSVVVKDDLVASKCITELKNSKLGVITFLPMNKIKPRTKTDTKSLIKKTGVQGLAIDLIKFDKKYKNVFDYVFGSTLVVDKIETARKIGIGKIRMVTLDGDLVEPSGAMIGGYRSKNVIGFNQKEMGKKILSLEKETSLLNKEIKEDITRRSEIDHEIESLRKKKSELYGDIVNIEKSLGVNTSEELLKEKTQLEKNKLELDKELSTVQKDISRFELDTENIKKNKNDIKEKLINNPEIKDNLSKLENEKETLKGDIMNSNSEINIVQNQINMYSDEISKVKNILSGHEKENLEFKKELEDLDQVIKSKKVSLKENEVKEREFYGKNKSLAAKRNKIMELLKIKEENIATEEERINSIRNRSNEVSISLAKITGEIEGLETEFEEYKDGTIRKGRSIDELKKEINEFEKLMSNIGSINMRALEVYDEVNKQYEELLNKTNKLKSEKDDVLGLIGEIEEKKTGVFMETFGTLNSTFKEIFGSISTKGVASLVLDNPEKPLDGGVDINVKISGNKKLDIRSLSGGEKTLAALAFIFSIQEHNPASFYLLDEVDAALDKHNSEKLSSLIANYSKKAQYVVVSHNDAIITEADQIYGVSMNEGITKVTSLKI